MVHSSYHLLFFWKKFDKGLQILGILEKVCWLGEARNLVLVIKNYQEMYQSTGFFSSGVYSQYTPFLMWFRRCFASDGIDFSISLNA